MIEHSEWPAADAVHDQRLDERDEPEVDSDSDPDDDGFEEWRERRTDRERDFAEQLAYSEVPQ